VRQGLSWSRFRSRSEWNTSVGGWLLEKHGTATRRSWRMLHLGVDAGTGRIMASTPTPKDVDDASQAGLLLDQIAGAVASFTGDGACDQDRVYDSVAQRHPEAAVVVPPCANAMPSDTAENAPSLAFHRLPLHSFPPAAQAEPWLLRRRNLLGQLRSHSGTATYSTLPGTGA